MLLSFKYQVRFVITSANDNINDFCYLFFFVPKYFFYYILIELNNFFRVVVENVELVSKAYCKWPMVEKIYFIFFKYI